ncbi:MAG: extracellular solute-binding protein [Anaerolineae bacterium]|nr:extracellular solute-binding protein [Anaerolineae bacterium]
MRLSYQAFVTVLMTPLIALVGCSTTQANQPRTTEPILTNTPMSVAQDATVTPTVTLAPTEAGPVRLSVWWPEPLAPLDNGDAVDVLSEQISAFQVAQGNVEVELRWKNEADPGGILSTLRTASPVAPGALPDLTLLRREDLLEAVESGLVHPLEGKITSAVLGDLYSRALQLGQVDGGLFGLPYALEIQQMVYQESEESVSWRFADILEARQSFVFPAGGTDGLNNLFFAQYLAAGGTPPSGGTLNLDEEALRTTLDFYEQAVAEGLIDPVVLSYTSTEDYLAGLVSGTLNAGVIYSTDYLSMLSENQQLAFGPIPTVNGTPTSDIDGWMWVLTTPNADRQELAVRFLNWMMNADRQGTYTRTVFMLPSQRSALQQWGDSPYNAFIREVMTNATLPLAENDGGSIARALQTAFTSVITGQSSSEDATRTLVDQFESS